MLADDQYAAALGVLRGAWRRVPGRAFGLILLGEGQVDDRQKNRPQEEDAGPERPQTLPTLLVGQTQKVADVRTERSGQDECEPEAQHRSGAEPPRHEDRSDQARRQQHRLAWA